MLRFPERLTFYEDQEVALDWLLPWGITLNPLQAEAREAQQPGVVLAKEQQTIAFTSAEAFLATDYELRLGGIIPLKRVAVEYIPQLEVNVGGQSVGLTIQPEGVMVVGFSPVRQEDGTWRTPGKEAGLRSGDLLLRINGVAISRVEEAARAIDAAARRQEALTMTIRRQDEETNIVVEPIWDADALVYRIGIVIRDETSGLGTLTFFSPENYAYAALGHIVTEMDSQMPVALEQGEIVEVEVVGLTRGQQASPGEKHGQKAGAIIGDIDVNSEFGVFGHLNQTLSNPLVPQAVPVALVHQVRPGPAVLYTVLDGTRVEAFAIEIEQVYYQSNPAVKGMVLHITDPELLERCGGIVQGMSGSPIVQNGALVGAVTHVFINDPARGYGVFAEWMLRQSGLFNELLTRSRSNVERRVA